MDSAADLVVTLGSVSSVEAVVLAALAAALLVVVMHALGLNPPASETDPSPPRRRDSMFVLVFLFIALAGTVAVVDSGVATDDEADEQKAEKAKKAKKPPATPAAWGVTAADLAAFRGPVTVHAGQRDSELCLMSFYSADAAASDSRWWTSCETAASLGSIAAVRDRLVLPRSTDGSLTRDRRATLRIPAGDEVAYISGRAAARCPDGEAGCYHGGAVLYRLMNLDADWIDATECAKGDDEQAKLEYGSCDEIAGDG